MSLDSSNTDAAWIIEGQFGKWLVQLPRNTSGGIPASASSNKYKHQLSLCLDSLILKCTQRVAFIRGENRRLCPLTLRETNNPSSIPILPSGDGFKLLGRLRPLFQLAQQLPLPFWPATTEAAGQRDLRKTRNPYRIRILHKINSALEQAYAKWPPDSNEWTGSSPSQAPATRHAFRWLSESNDLRLNHSSTLDWLPDPEAPFAWRIIADIHQMETRGRTIMNTKPFDPYTQSIRGAHSIEASAGTGKKPIRLLDLFGSGSSRSRTCRSDQISVSTFTKAATG